MAGVAVAAKGGSSKDVTLCAGKGGALSLAPKSGKCGKGAKKLVIAKQGPQGIPGPAGPAGAAGTTAPIQPEAIRLVSPWVPVPYECPPEPGTFCSNWENLAGWGQVGFQRDAAGYVHLRGAADGGGEGQTAERIFYLTPGYRPSVKIQVAATECNGTPISVLIGADGSVDPDLVNSNCVVLDGISFRP